jgi:predicted acylesterase/phospholipase RssA
MPASHSDRFRMLAIDGGGIRGLIAARVIARLEELISEEAGEQRRLADCFHLIAGTSTGGLLALGLTAPDPAHPGRPRLTGNDLVNLYVQDGPRIFGDRLHQLLSLGGWIAPKHSPKQLERTLRERLGDADLSQALRDVLVVSYDMAEPGPYFFKRWQARDAKEPDPPMVDVGMATAAAPTYLPSRGLGGRALVDGGLFAANPSIAAVVEALKRRDREPKDLRPQDLLLVSLGTGQHEVGHSQSEVSRWGRIGWIWPRREDPALIAAFLDGQSDAADHWADVLLNRQTGERRYYRFQATLEEGTPLDDASRRALDELTAAADRLLVERDADLRELAVRLAPDTPLPA